MKAILFWPYQLYVWLIFLPLVIVLTLLFSFLTVIFATLVNPEWASRVFAATWGKLLATLTPVKVTVEGAENARPGQSYVVASNHQSQFDILLIYGWLKLDLKWVMKKELRKIPGIGIGCEKAGHIFVDRSDPKQARRAISEALDCISRGVGILFFPEGTRSLDGRLLSFKKGAFRLAKDQELPLLPITLVGTRDVLPARSLRLFPGAIKMVIHPAIHPDDKSVEQLIDETRAAIRSGMPAELR
ncbi:MAG: 1-acyl-sn-glycerol-3-phosphate acyltransferase [Xanthomonadales bacterium]|jgi:1-acyl-sn-glycerol-3-phosphate acyltransferase|nr:1-acyl-sn-glycerol-3-phosphate acyltransferase [Xanthomonadales bacterium]MDH3925184.1 1-acyl-sn-glycerol-3-phosphate acyltransferase [Xanthomonadales bacterium]MDH3942439.1 1-acyl-sn-glycerol-3-phosphate acyltransferase [Xanthomonadales bacterium]MDH4002453.1 1-acyl-sn-glycerol-3-phosphate acyltransferase [Xanthomonadales bacterium]